MFFGRNNYSVLSLFLKQLPFFYDMIMNVFYVHTRRNYVPEFQDGNVARGEEKDGTEERR